LYLIALVELVKIQVIILNNIRILKKNVNRKSQEQICLPLIWVLQNKLNNKSPKSYLCQSFGQNQTSKKTIKNISLKHFAER
jgi:hypothetical protein